MVSGNTIQSVGMVLLIFAAIYFAALGIVELKKLIDRKKHKKEDDL